mmetsp:Transcript_53402/g.134125  ORF Transcript_53402/g.134125 Transcript_53402/m.134125 type:complete len:204 (-) Transcript_53402:537-1148(-)
MYQQQQYHHGGYPPPQQPQQYGGAPQYGAAAPQWGSDPEILKIKQSFAAADLSRAGFLTLPQLSKTPICGVKFPLKACQLLAKTFDTNGSGKIEMDEFVQIVQFIKQMKMAFDVYDTNKSGTLSKEEVKCALQQGGFPLQPSVVYMLFVKICGGLEKQMKIEDFIVMCAFLGVMRSKFNEADTDRDGWAYMCLEQLVNYAAFT